MREISKYAACLSLVGLAACSSLGMGGGSNTYSSRAVVPAPSPVAADTIRQVQASLQRDGYYKQGNVDGVWGTGTEDAVQSFQRDHSLTANGKLDVPTLQAMNLTNGNPPPPVRADNQPPYNPPQNAPAVSSPPNNSTR